MALSLDRGPGGLAATPPHAQGQRVGVDRDGRLARRGGDPRRGDPPGAAARPDLPARRSRRRRRWSLEAGRRRDRRPGGDGGGAAGRRRPAGTSRWPAARRRGPPTSGRRPWSVRLVRRPTFWFGDDRCVPPDHEHSNYRMAREALLDRIAAAAAVHRIEGELGLRGGARTTTSASCSEAFGDGVPELDLILLGLGPGRAHRLAVPGRRRARRAGAPGRGRARRRGWRRSCRG